MTNKDDDDDNNDDDDDDMCIGLDARKGCSLYTL